MDAIAEQLDAKLQQWEVPTRERVRALVTEIIELADGDGLELLRSRRVEQEVLDLIDEPASR